MRALARIVSGGALAGFLAASSQGVAQDAANAQRGQRLFIQCQACHALQAGVSANVGPSLAGVLGRRAGSITGYSYSQALRTSGLIWDVATLDKWLEHPDALVPGTKMIFAGVANPADRLAIIAYLEKFGDAK